MTSEATLAFVIPIRPKATSKDWRRVSELSRRAVDSTLRQQGGGRFATIVVCNEVPDGIAASDKVRIEAIDTPVPEPVQPSREADKARKLEHGFAVADQLGFTHTMAVDADDCISNRIAGFVTAQPHDAPGWLSRQGYIWQEGRPFAIKNTKNFSHTCGSSAVLRNDLQEHLFGEGPWYWFEEPSSRFPGGRPELDPLPFPAAFYSVMNGENIFFTRDRPTRQRGAASLVSYYLPRLAKWRPVLITPRLRREYGL